MIILNQNKTFQTMAEEQQQEKKAKPLTFAGKFHSL
jgi:hypothetical protein